MNKNARRIVALAVIAGAYFTSNLNVRAADEESRQAAVARAKDPSWKPSALESGSIKVGDGRASGTLKNFCLNADGNILACVAPGGTAKAGSAENASGIRVYSPDGKLLKTLPLEIKPAAVCVVKDGSIFVAGDGRLLKLDAAGKVLASAASPVAAVPVVITKEMEEMTKQSGRSGDAEIQRTKTNLDRRRADVTGLAATDEDVFIVVPTPNEYTYQVYRFDHALQNPKLVVEKLRGCCGQMDIQARAEKLWIPHNGRHSVEARDRDGKVLSKFGTRGKVKAEDFGGCCEPKNMRVLANGDVLVAESGPPTCIKRFSATGKFLGVVAIVDDKAECVRVTVEMTPDASTFYLMDTQHNAIRVFKTKG
jgi:hypothetical protein